LGLFKINFDGRSVQGFSNPKSQSWKNRLVVNGSFPSHWSQQQNATINHPITGADKIAFLKKKVQEVLQVVNEASNEMMRSMEKNGWDSYRIYI
jgi:hypothetical protein